MPPKTHKQRLVLLDTHAILHRAYHGMPDFVSSKGEPTGALYGLSSMLLKIMQEFDPDHIAACFDLAEPTFRKEMYEKYKAGRSKTDDALVGQIIRARDVLEAFSVPLYEKAGFEADDGLGSIVEETKNNKDLEIIIASGDHDTLALAADPRVKIFTLRKGITDTVIYDKNAVIEKYGFEPELLPDYKALRGDPSDNIPGVAGIGEKTATDLIQKFGKIDDLYEILESDRNRVLDSGIKERIVGLLEDQKEEAFFSKTLATIRTDADLGFKLNGAPWRELIDWERVRALFEELEFRSLTRRIDEILGSAKAEVKEAESEPKEEVEADDLVRIGIALWLLNSDIGEPSLEDIYMYAKTKNFKEAQKKILEDIEGKGLTKVYKDIELPLIPILERAQERGILVDTKELAKLSKQYHTELDALQEKIYATSGSEFNIKSPKQLGEVLFGTMGLKPPRKTSTGQASTNAAVLEKLRDKHPIVEDILSYRELAKLLSTYIDNFPAMLDENNRLHTTFVQTGTATGRFSSRDPNMQNMPIKTEHGRKIRKAFRASPGYVFGAFDYSQIDLRSLALLSGDKKLTSVFKSGGDVHAEVASEVFGVSPADVDKEMRRKAKVINFGIVYGMGVTALRQNLGTTRNEAQTFLDGYFEKFPGVARYIDATIASAREKGYTETFFGRRRYYPGFNSNMEYVQKMAERMAQNAPVQGTSADIIKIAMVAVDRELEKRKLREDVQLLIQIHDELLYEIREDKAEEIGSEIIKIMEGVIPESPIEFPVKANYGRDWGAL